MIPKNLAQIYIGKQLQDFDYLKHLSSRWQEVYDDWNYKLYLDKDVENEIKKFSSDAWKTYQKIPSNTMKSDLARYIIIYNNGGMYVDMDSVPKYKINDFIDLKTCSIIIISNFDKEYNQRFVHASVFLSEKKNKLIKKFIDYMISSIINNNSENINFIDILYEKWSNEYFYENIPIFKQLVEFCSGGSSDLFAFDKNNKLIASHNGDYLYTHFGSIMLNDFLSINPNTNILEALNHRYKDLILDNGGIKILTKESRNWLLT